MAPPARVLSYAVLFGAYVAALHALPGPWRGWKRGRAGQPLDPWTITHVAWGAIGAAMGLPAGQVLGLSLVNEAGEAAVRELRPDLLWGEPETPANVLVDLAATWVGHRAWELVRRS